MSARTTAVRSAAMAFLEMRCSCTCARTVARQTGSWAAGTTAYRPPCAVGAVGHNALMQPLPPMLCRSCGAIDTPRLAPTPALTVSNEEGRPMADDHRLHEDIQRTCADLGT